MGLLPYAARDVLRNRRRTISSILGVLLAVTFVAGTFIAIDSSARATLDATLAGIPGDFSFYSSFFDSATFDYTVVEGALLGVVGVDNASMYRTIPITQFENPAQNSSPQFYGSQLWAIDPDHLPAGIKDLSVTGSLALPRGSVGVTQDLATQLRVGIGDRVAAVYGYSYGGRNQVNLTVTALIENPTSGYPYPYAATSGVALSQVPIYGSFAVVHMRDANWVLGQLNETQSYCCLNGEVWIDRAHYVNPYDVDASTRSLERIQRRLEAVLGPGVYVSNNILPRIQEFQNRIAGQRVQYLLLSMPVVLLGVYLGAVGVDLSHAERRRELAVLKTRGAKRRQLIGLLLLEAIVGGLIAAVVGLAVGVGLSRFLLGVVNPTSGTSPPFESFILSTDTIVIVALLSMALMGLVAYRSAKRTASLSIIETLRYYSPGETNIQYNPRNDIILVTVGLLDYFLVWWRPTASLWTFLLSIVSFVLLPFVPLMLIVGFTRLFTRGTGKVYDWFSHAVKPLVRDLYHVVRRNLSRNPRRSSNVAIIIALGLAFGVFSLSLLATNNTHAEREIRALVGADMAVRPVFSGSDLRANLSRISGVVDVTKVSFLPIDARYCCASVYAIDPVSYWSVAQPEWWYFPDGNPAKAQGVLSMTGQVLASQGYLDQAFLEVGDQILLSANVYDQNGTYTRTVFSNATIGGVVRFLPGTTYGSYQPAIYATHATLAPFFDAFRNSSSISASYLVDLAPGTDWRTVRTTMFEDSNVASADAVGARLEALNSDPFARAFYGFVALEIAFIVVILTVGVGIILFAASLERDTEFAAIIARGSSGWQTAKLLVGEAFVIMLVGLVIGVAVGLGTAFFAIQFLTAGPAGTQTTPVPYLFVFPVDALLLVTLGPAAMLFSALLVSARTARMNVAKVLKLRGG